MAIIINTEILGQQAEGTLTYCYLYEPLRVSIADSDITSEKLYIDVVRVFKSDSVVNNTLVKYVDLDFNPGLPLTVDLMEIVKQLHNSNIYKIAKVSDIPLSSSNMIVSEYFYEFHIYSDKSSTPSIIRKLPIIGGRSFNQFSPLVDLGQSLNEFAYYNIDQNLISSQWSNFTFYRSDLSNLSIGTNFDPILTGLSNSSLCTAEGALYWKSRFGGWMYWAFDIIKENSNNSYSGNLSVGMFKSSAEIGGFPYIPVDYTSISSTYSLEMKSLSIPIDTLKALSGISSSPAIYYNDGKSDRLELMRLTSASAPISSLANGGDFTVGLQSISITSQKTI